MRPTDRQLEALAALTDGALLDKALASMHALNRRAKEKRDRRNRYRRCDFAAAIEKEIDGIYELKDSFVAALTDAGLSTVRWFERKTDRMVCSCGNSWRGDSFCFTCGGEAVQIKVDRWHIVECRGYSFHVLPGAATPTMMQLAVPGPAHDPWQPKRKIPNVGLTVEAQRRCVELCVERIAVATPVRSSTTHVCIEARP